MEVETVSKPRSENSIGEPAGIDSFYTLEEIYGAKRYRNPLYCKMFSKGGRKAYLDALRLRYLTLLDYLFLEKESRTFRRELFLQELEVLIGELKQIEPSCGYLQDFLKTKGSEGGPVYEKIWLLLEGSRKQKKSSYSILFTMLGSGALVVLGLYIHFRFILPS